MTGRDLIVYILENHLEDDPIFSGKRFLNLMTAEELALKYQVGMATVSAWLDLGIIDGANIGDKIYIMPNNKLSSLDQ